MSAATYTHNGKTMTLIDDYAIAASGKLRVQPSYLEEGGLFLEVETPINELGGCVWLTPLQVDLLLDFIEDKVLIQ